MCALCHSWILARPGEVAWRAEACSKQNRAGGRGGLEAREAVLSLFSSGEPGVAKTKGESQDSFSPDVVELRACPSRVSPDLGIWGCGFTVSDTG